jgi:prepilin signal peptidase PulO-like enzyme (type II secretory pathway)
VAPFLGLGWAIFRLIAHRSREIPYGPFLSIATVIVMIFHDYIVLYFAQAMTPHSVMP